MGFLTTLFQLVFKSSAFNRALPTFRKQLNYNKIFFFKSSKSQRCEKTARLKKSKNKKNCKKADKQKRFSKWLSDKSINFQNRLVTTASIYLRMFYLLYHLPCKKSTIFSASFKKRGGKMKKFPPSFLLFPHFNRRRRFLFLP